MNIAVIGAGYVGLTTGAVLAAQGHRVVIVERVREKISQLTRGEIPFFEPGLDQVVRDQSDQGHLTFAGSLDDTGNPDAYLICVGTPPLPDGSPDLSSFREVLRGLAESVRPGQLIITKSSVPPGTNEWIASELQSHGIDITRSPVISNPEFLREGTAVRDTLHPSRIVYGLAADTSEADLAQWLPKLRELYAGISAPMMVTTWEGAELIKYASNAFLANKISFINEMARIADAYAVRIEDVAAGIGMDPRIGPDFLRAGLGYGGSCLPKDLAALMVSARCKGVDVSLLPAAETVNRSQIDWYVERLAQELPGGTGKVGIWGLSFKADTDDTRMSPAIALIKQLLRRGFDVSVFDPQASVEKSELSEFNMSQPARTQAISECCTNQEQRAIHTSVTSAPSRCIQVKSKEAAADGADALVVCTDWSAFQQDAVNWTDIAARMNGEKWVVDTRNLYDPSALRNAGFGYLAVARPDHQLKTRIFPAT